MNNSAENMWGGTTVGAGNGHISDTTLVMNKAQGVPFVSALDVKDVN